MDIFKTGDLCVFDFLQFYRKTQTESVAQYSDMLNILDGVDVSDKFKMLLLEETLFEK
jgi:ferritin